MSNSGDHFSLMKRTNTKDSEEWIFRHLKATLYRPVTFMFIQVEAVFDSNIN